MSRALEDYGIAAAAATAVRPGAAADMAWYALEFWIRSQSRSVPAAAASRAAEETLHRVVFLSRVSASARRAETLLVHRAGFQRGVRERLQVSHEATVPRLCCALLLQST